MTYTPLASASDIQSYPGLAVVTRTWSAAQQATLMTAASRAIESRCERRLAPFSGVTESSKAVGIDVQGVVGDDFPLDLVGALGRSRQMAFGALRMVRDMWLKEYAPIYQDQWSYSLGGILLERAYGDTEAVDVGSLEGPELDTGHIRFRLGTFIPEGTNIRVTYGGGYSPVPYDLNLACVLQATKLAILTASPEVREGMSTVELDAEILGLIAPFIR